MNTPFASGKRAIAICDRCGQQYRLRDLRTLTIKLQKVDLLVCPDCWEPDQPQLQVGMYPVVDPQALRNPRRDTTYVQAGQNVDGFPTGGSRDIQWGWNPVGGASYFDSDLTPNNLVLAVEIGTVTVATT